MSRYFNGQEVELLAPVGTFEIFKQVFENKKGEKNGRLFKVYRKVFRRN